MCDSLVSVHVLVVWLQSVPMRLPYVNTKGRVSVGEGVGESSPSCETEYGQFVFFFPSVCLVVILCVLFPKSYVLLIKVHGVLGPIVYDTEPDSSYLSFGAVGIVKRDLPDWFKWEGPLSS